MNLTVDMVNQYSSQWWDVVCRASWQGGIALIVVMLICRMFQQLPPGVQCWMWRLAFLKLLLAGLLMNPMQLHVLPSEVLSATSPEFELEFVATPPLDHRTASTTLGIAGNSPQNSIPAASIGQLNLTSWLMIAWLAGALLSLVGLLRNWVHTHAIIRSIPTMKDADALRYAAECCDVSNVRQPEIRISTKSVGPFLVGAFCPCIVLPSSLLKPDAVDELKFAILHELAHVRRRDLMWNWLPAIAGAVFFFYPLVWLAKRESSFGQEAATDELTVSMSGRSIAQYAHSLVVLAQKFPSAGAMPDFAVSGTTSYAQLRRRLIAMKTFPNITILRCRILLAAILMIAILGIVPWQLVAKQTEVTSDSPTPPATEKSEDAPPAATRQDNTESAAKTEPRAITIRVVDSAGKLLTGARVFRNHVYQPADQKRTKIENKYYRTDANGEVAVDLSGASVDLRIWVTMKGFVSLHAMWASKFQSDGHLIPETFTFEMVRGTEIGGLVTDELGQPIEGVKVEVQDMLAGKATSIGNSKPGKRPVRQYMLSHGKNAAKTDVNGRWTVSRVPDDEALERPEDGLDDQKAAKPDEPAPLKIALRLSHPKYDGDRLVKSGFTQELSREWGGVQRKQRITLKSLREKTATIVLKRAFEPDR